MRNRSSLIIVFLFAILTLAAGCGIVESTPDERDQSGTGTLILAIQTVPEGSSGRFAASGVPGCPQPEVDEEGEETSSMPLCINSGSSLSDSGLEPGTYSTTLIDPAPDFDVTAVVCDDADSETPSSGDAATRTAIFNLDPGEEVTCTFTVAQRGAIAVGVATVPEGSPGLFAISGIPGCPQFEADEEDEEDTFMPPCVSTGGSIAESGLAPGTYSTTLVDPAPDFDVTAVVCDDADSETPSSGDAATRTAIMNLDPGEIINCTFTVTKRASAMVVVVAEPPDLNSLFAFSGVPGCPQPEEDEEMEPCISSGGAIAEGNLPTGTYATTLINLPADFNLEVVKCDDAGSDTPSSGDPVTRTALFNLDPGETVTCMFANIDADIPDIEVSRILGSSQGSGDTYEEGEEGLRNPFENPAVDLEDFPAPVDLPPDAGEYPIPKGGPWTVNNLSGTMDCGGTSSLSIPASPPETGTLDVLDNGRTIIGTGLETNQGVSITMTASLEFVGRYTGSLEFQEEGVPATIHYYWQLVTDEWIIGYLTGSMTSQGATCNIYRPFEMWYEG